MFSRVSLKNLKMHALVCLTLLLVIRSISSANPSQSDANTRSREELIKNALASVGRVQGEIAKLRALLRQAGESIGDLDAFTRLSRDFHLAVAEASHNRVLVVQLISLEHVSWPRRNVTATPKLARHILEIHTKLADLIELRDAAGARALMDDHVKMIRARRVAERDHNRETACC